MTSINSDIGGNVQVADDVVAIVAGTAALEVEGVSSLVGKISGGLKEIISKKHFSKGVSVNISDEKASISLSITVKNTFNIQQVALGVQKNIKNAVETMIGIEIDEVNVSVAGIDFEKEVNVKAQPKVENEE